MSNDGLTRHSTAAPCPVCGGHDRWPRGQGVRCHGFRTADGWVHCSREDHAGHATFHPKSLTYSHKARGPCPCGVAHAPEIPGNGRPKEIVRAYPYRDESSTLLFECVRYHPKGFAQRRPDDKGGWIHNLQGVRRVLYCLPELLASDPAEVVIIPEGEKDVDRLRAAGFTATCNPMGAGKWRDEYARDLKGRHVAILPDNDQAGRDHAAQVARSLSAVAASVQVVELPGLPEKGDVSDFLDAGGMADDLRRLITDAPLWTPDARTAAGETPQADHEEKKGRPRASDALLALTDGVELFHASDGRAYAWVGVGSHFEVLAVRSQAFRRWLLRAFYNREGRAPTGEALRDALGVIEARALYDGPSREVFVRVGSDPDGAAIDLDLGDADWRAVKITPAGWSILDRSPVPFRRAAGVLPLPTPTTGGSIAALRTYLNLPDEDSWRLLVAWIAAALRPIGPYPVLVVLGEQGSAKSTASRVVRGAVDPNATPLRSGPRDERDLMIAANASWVVALDNLDALSPWLSDALCRLATGGGFSTRALYTDDEETLVTATRPLLLNGIDGVATRPDLLDRAIVLKLPAIPDEARREEAAVWREWEADRGAILGALLDTVSAAMHLLPEVHPERLPRMADFARWGEAVGRALGWGETAFLDAYRRNIGSVTEAAAEGSAVAAAVRGFMAERSEWEGLPADLLRELTTFVGEPMARARGWPTKPNRLTVELTRVAPVLRRLGISVTRLPRTRRGNPVMLSRTRPPQVQENTSTTSTISTAADFPGPARGDGVEMVGPGAATISTPSPPRAPLFSRPGGDGGGGGDDFPPSTGESVDPWTEVGEWTA